MKNKNIIKYQYHITRIFREKLNQHKSIVIWLTGLSGSGKSTLSNFLEKKLYKIGIRTYVIDGDNIRKGLCNDLNFSYQDRKENIRRISELAKIMIDAGIVVIVSVISPYSSEREKAKNKIGPKNFFEIFIDTPIEICEKRDPKSFYKKAKLGKLKNFTGIDSNYEIPKNPDMHLNGEKKITVLVEETFKKIKNIIINK